jgi:hypothetical protein
VSERQASVHTHGSGRLSRDRDRDPDETLHGGPGVAGASARRFAGRTRKVTRARPVTGQHDLSVAPRAGGGPAHSVVPRAGGGPGHDDIGENS